MMSCLEAIYFNETNMLNIWIERCFCCLLFCIFQFHWEKIVVFNQTYKPRSF